jgi:hypothetical protein
MGAHLWTRTVTAATAPLVRNLGPALADGVKHLLQFFAFGFLGVVVIIFSGILSANGIPAATMKTVASIVGLSVVVIGLLVVVEQVRLTYRRQIVSVYSKVEPFEQRRPIDDGLE